MMRAILGKVMHWQLDLQLGRFEASHVPTVGTCRGRSPALRESSCAPRETSKVANTDASGASAFAICQVRVKLNRNQ
jgi:hypothetical protein